MRNNEIFIKDLDYIAFHSNVDFSIIENKTILITGSTGLIGFNVVSSLLYYSLKSNAKLKVIILVRDVEKAKKIFSNFKTKNLFIKMCDLEKPIRIKNDIDYIIHSANFTHSKDFIKKPLDVINFSINSTKHLLNLAKEKKSKFLYISSVEVYGSPTTEDKITENYHTNVNSMEVRSSYPESKRMCENLCCAYNSQFNVPAKVVRLAQTFGPGIAKDDNRAFAYFAQCAADNKDIILKTKGNTKKTYLYTADAVTAIFSVLLYGNNGEAYNASNDNTYLTIYDVAKMICKLKNNQIKIKFDLNNNKDIYLKIMKLNLSSRKLRNIGWEAKTSMFKALDNLLKTYSLN